MTSIPNLLCEYRQNPLSIEPAPAQPGYRHICPSPQHSGELMSAAGRVKML
jgi:hypothetical protein